MSDDLVHFVGGRRGGHALPEEVRHLSTEQRLDRILTEGHLRRFPTSNTGTRPTLCVSDLSAAELEAAFARGLDTRGPLEPWALVLDRRASWDAGFRPVLYTDHRQAGPLRGALQRIYGPDGAALVIDTTVGVDGWTSEREWRHVPTAAASEPGRTGRGATLKALIVGTPGWMPTSLHPELRNRRLQRWLWDPEHRCLVHDGHLDQPRTHARPAELLRLLEAQVERLHR